VANAGTGSCRRLLRQAVIKIKIKASTGGVKLNGTMLS
jgi:hypothetical protein